MEEQVRAAVEDSGRDRHEGWLDVIQTTGWSLDSYRSETLVEFKAGWTELRRFEWSEQVRSLWSTCDRCYFLSLALDGTDDTSRRNLAATPARECGGSRVLLVAPGQTISSVSPSNGRRRSLCCVIDADFVESICITRPTPENRACLGTIEASGGKMEWLMFRLYREVSGAEIGMEIAVESIAHEIAVEIARMLERQRGTGRRRSGGLPPWRLRMILSRLNAGGPLPSVPALAEMSGMTPRHLTRVLQAEMGITVGQLIAGVMAERADRMLKTGMSVAAVASSLGYARSSSFSHAFRRETGVLPSSVAVDHCPGALDLQ